MRKICTFLFFLSLFLHSNQSLAQSIDSVKVSGFLEVYFGKDQAIWNNHSRPNFLYSHTATDHVALNTAVFELKSYSKRINTHLALVEGTYANKVTSAEPTGFGALYLANISLALDQAKNCWLTAGIFPSHIGLETAIGLTNVSLTRSLAAENSPYYESGVKLDYVSKNKIWNFSLLGLNGWQTMTLLPQDHQMGIGSSISFQPNAKFFVSHNTYFGEVALIDTSAQRLFNNVQFQLKSNDWTLQGQWDFGIQKGEKWHVGFLGIGRNINKRINLNSRVEYVNDPKSLVMGSSLNSVYGGSIGGWYKLAPHATLRAEYRYFRSLNETPFQFKSSSSKTMQGLTLSLAVQF
jgi:hypothetical protein